MMKQAKKMIAMAVTAVVLASGIAFADGLVGSMVNMGIDIENNYYEFVEEDSIDWDAQIQQRVKENKKKAKAKRNNSSIYIVAEDGWCYFKDVNTNEEVRVKLPE